MSHSGFSRMLSVHYLTRRETLASCLLADKTMMRRRLLW